MVSVVSEWYREEATKRVALRALIEEIGDTRLVGLQEERDYLFQENEGTKEIHAEWGAMARKIAPLAEGDRGCDCSSCAISRALRKAAGA